MMMLSDVISTYLFFVMNEKQSKIGFRNFSSISEGSKGALSYRVTYLLLYFYLFIRSIFYNFSYLLEVDFEENR